jgi:hypothetical protein
MLKKTLKSLDYGKLALRSEDGLIGCPFLEKYGGPVPYATTCFGKHCKYLCGAMFKNLDGACPCIRFDERFVKKRFWKYLNEAVAGLPRKMSGR